MRFCGVWRCRWAVVVVAVALAGRAEAIDSPASECDANDLEDECFMFYDNAKHWSPKFDLQDTINSFTVSPYGNEAAFPATERTQEGILFVPGLEVRIAKKPGCTFAGAVMLSESEDCKVDPEKSSQVEEMENARSNNFRFLLSLPEASVKLFTGKPNAKFADMSAAKVNLRLFLCVKSGPAEDFRPMHLVWYYQDPHPGGPMSIWQARDAKFHPYLELKNPHAWRDEERYRMAPITLEGISTDLPHFSYTLMHFKVKAEGDDKASLKGGSAVARRPVLLVSAAVLAVAYLAQIG